MTATATQPQPLFVIDPALARTLQPGSEHSTGTAPVLASLLPQLCEPVEKKSQPLRKVDHYMLEETGELLRRLRGFCDRLQIDRKARFKIARNGKDLCVVGDIDQCESLARLINQDAWFVDSFLWLQPNYASLAHSFEVLAFSEHYREAPEEAAARYGYLVHGDSALSFMLNYDCGHAHAQVESPLNLYCVE